MEDKKKIKPSPMLRERDYVIAYIDLLGTKKLLEKKEKNVFEDIYYAFLFAGEIMPKTNFLNWEKMKVKIFSDNILIAFPINNADDKNDVYDAYREIEGFLKFFLYMLANKGHLFRGAITVDKLFIDELMVWGKGLSSVVYLEENVAIYPRIVLSEDLLKVFDRFGLFGERFEKKFSCMKDVDNCVFFDFFDYYDHKSMDSLIYLTNKSIEEKMQGEESPRVMQKYCWFKNYIDRVSEIYSKIKQSVKL